jgi:hypothetical protein
MQRCPVVEVASKIKPQRPEFTNSAFRSPTHNHSCDSVKILPGAAKQMKVSHKANVHHQSITI